MTWSLYAGNGAGATFLSYANINNYGGDLAFHANTSDRIHLFDIPNATGTRIGDIGDFSPDPNLDTSIVLANGTLYYVGASQSPNRRQILSYDGTPHNWTHRATLDSATDTTGNIDMSATAGSGNNRLIINIGRKIADGSNEQVAVSSNGIAWTTTSLINNSAARSINRPITVKNSNTYSWILNVAGNYQLASYNGSSWSLDSTEWDSTVYDTVACNWVDQEKTGGGFTGAWLRRLSDGVALRSTDGGASFSETTFNTTGTFTISASNTAMWALNGLEFCVSGASGSDRLWYFDGTEWTLVDSGALPGASSGVAGVVYDDAENLYLLFSGSLYTSSEFEFPAAPPAGETGIYAISMSLETETDGTTLFITAFDIDSGNLVLQRWNTDTMTMDMEIPLGTATLTQVQNRTKTAYVFAASDQLVWVYGQMDGAGWAGPTGTFWLAESGSGGVSGSFSAFNLGWDTNSTLAALHVSADLSGTDTRLFTGIRCKTTTPPQLYQDLNALTLVLTTPLATGTFIHHTAMDIGLNSGNVIVGGVTGAGTNRIAMTIPPYSGWVDMTDNHPSGTFQVVRFF